ncbi:DUF1697 domain-containing protein [Sphingomonas naphthae]|uniref:DUF1697 domain-containing protein n=1 Tax=Sphingomonas naphthae TaxID=1813468 RepID=A0ABY7TN20_9SPHN|nr:DUF1697 domain-containing protein [Sphingomonas naphthae]WCT74082.1 DUF1697 domain-containing protein [Sphingomonas naphthae]
MGKATTRWIVLLRGVNVGGNRKVPMAELRAALGEAGAANARTYIASGNILFESDGDTAAAEALVESVIAARFGFPVEAVARSAEQWAGYAAQDPFPNASPKLLHLCLAKRPIAAGAVAAIEAKCADGERVARAGEALWIDYGAGVADSKLTPALLDKAAGSMVTARNRNTVLKLAAMIAQ